MNSFLFLNMVALAGGPEATWRAPDLHIAGSSFKVHLELVAPEAGATLVGWLLTPAAFSVDGHPIAEREDRGTVQLPQGARLTFDIDLGPFITAEKDFVLEYAKEVLPTEAVSVAVLQPAAQAVDFQTIPVEELSRYQALLSTNQGDMLVKFWPETAPNHVRNFLDLCLTGFYDGTLFHRVGKNFMIQGGDPNTKQDNPDMWGQGSGPRRIKLEPSDKKHVRGVLSMARNRNPDSATSQFFVMHGANPGLDGQYSAFGELVRGLDVLDRIAMSEVGKMLDGATWRPKQPQRILKATVVEKGD